MKYKKGAIEIQFNWLFVLIVGAVILIIFSGIILRQKNISETSKNVLILNNLDAILAGSESSSGTVNVVKIPESNIEFRCNRYSIGKLSKQLDVMNVFPSSVLEGDRIIAMTLDFSIPYRITNLIYLTSPNYRYVFVGDNALTRQISNLMPNETFSETFSNLGEVNYRGESNVRFVFFNVPFDIEKPFGFNLKEYSSLTDKGVTGLNIKGDSESGVIEFLQKKGDKLELIGTSSYLGKESLLGAIFSDSPEVYGCAMDNVFEKISIVTDVYLGKVQRIREIYSENYDRCSNFMDTVYDINSLNKIKTSSREFNEQNSENIISAAKNLRSQNKQAQLQSCATIY